MVDSHVVTCLLFCLLFICYRIIIIIKICTSLARLEGALHKHRWPLRERLPLPATLDVNSMLQCSCCLGTFVHTTSENEM